MEVKKQEEEDDEGADTQAEGKGKMGKMGKGQPDVKMEEKPEVRLSLLLKKKKCPKNLVKHFQSKNPNFRANRC